MTPVDQFSSVIVTGAGGWLGGRLVTLLAQGRFDHPRLTDWKSPNQIRCLLRDEEHSSWDAPADRIQIFKGDIRSPEAMHKVFEDASGSLLVHTAGVIHPQRPQDFQHINVEGTIHVLDAAIKAGVRRCVIISSNSPFGENPHIDHLFDEESPYHPYKGYGRSKMRVEQEALRRHRDGVLDVTLLRPPWFYGPNQPARQTEFFRMVRQGKFPLLGSGLQRRSMVYLDNLCQGIFLAAAQSIAKGETYWIADEHPYAMKDIIDTVESVLENEFHLPVAHRRIRLPSITGTLAGTVDGILQSAGLYHSKIHVLSEMSMTIACSVRKAQRDLGYAPRFALREGMRLSIQSCLDRGMTL